MHFIFATFFGFFFLFLLKTLLCSYQSSSSNFCTPLNNTWSRNFKMEIVLFCQDLKILEGQKTNSVKIFFFCWRQILCIERWLIWLQFCNQSTVARLHGNLVRKHVIFLGHRTHSFGNLLRKKQFGHQCVIGRTQTHVLTAKLRKASHWLIYRFWLRTSLIVYVVCYVFHDEIFCNFFFESHNIIHKKKNTTANFFIKNFK